MYTLIKENEASLYEAIRLNSPLMQPYEEVNMQQHQTMTLNEKLAITTKAAAMRKAGDEEGANRLLRTVPLPPYIAKVMKEKVGMEFFTSYNWNLSEVKAEFGSDYISK